MGKSPAFQFYPNDWINDPQLQMAGASTRGIWMNLLCAMWWAPTRGTVTGTREQLRKLAKCTTRELGIFLQEAGALGFANVMYGVTDNVTGVTDHNTIVTLTNRRMLRDEQSRISNTSRQRRFRNRQRDAKVTSSSPSPSPSTSLKQRSTLRKTLGGVVAEGDPPASCLQGWPSNLQDMPEKLREMKAPYVFYNQAYWVRIDHWVEGTKLPVYYLDELKAYLAHQASKTGSSRHRDLLAGYRNWLAKAIRWKENDAQRAEFARRAKDSR